MFWIWQEPELPEPTTKSGVASVVAGNPSCARLDSDAIECWGSNVNGYLGDGNATGLNDRNQSSPVGVLGLGGGSGAAQLSGKRGAVTCALLASGSAQCWGITSSLGIGSAATGPLTGYATDTPIPLAVPGATITSLELGGAACLTTSSGDARCWGSNASGQLGDGTTISRISPTQSVLVGF